MWLVYRWRDVVPPYRAIVRALDLDLYPATTITAAGVGAAGWRYLLTDELPPEAVVTRPRSRSARAQTGDKPPYRIPLLEEIRQLPWNGLNVISTFAGAGGSSTGYRMAGYRVLAAVEFVPAAADSYAANKAAYTTLLRRDIRGLDAGELLEAAGIGVGELDVLDGSPPCEPFSTAGLRDKTWGEVREYSGERQRVDDLFFEFARLVEGVQPRCFAAENVTGLVKGRAKGQFKRVMARLRACGYAVNARVLDAAWLGVPQSRQRVIIVGVREDLAAAPVFPAPLAYRYSVRDAIGDLLAGGAPMHGSHDRYREPSDIGDDPAPTVVAKSPGHWHVDATVRMGSFGRKHHPADITDEPAPTVVAGDSTYWHVEQVYEGHEFQEAARSLEEPAAAVRGGGGTIGHGAGADLRFYRDYSKGAAGRLIRRPRLRRIEPCPLVLASSLLKRTRATIRVEHSRSSFIIALMGSARPATGTGSMSHRRRSQGRRTPAITRSSSISR